MIKKNAVIFNFDGISKTFDFNSNLNSIIYFKKLKLLSFTFNNIASIQKEIECLDICANGCDLDFFEEFGDSCISGFKGAELANQAIISKSEEIYRTVIQFIKKENRQKKLNSLANNSKKVKARRA